MAAPERAAGCLHLLGTRLALSGAAPELVEGLLEVYADLGPPPPDATPRQLAARLGVLDRDGAVLDLGGLRLIGRGRGLRAAGAALAYPLFEVVARLERRLLLLHAGVVDRGGGAILLVGPSGAGKTTLAVALALRGAGFLSDEAAVLDPGTGLVRPFPRAVGLRPRSLALLRLDGASRVGSLHVEERGGRSKELVRLLGRGLAGPGGPAPPRHVVFLGGDPGAGPGGWCLELQAPAPEVGERLRKQPGIRGLRAGQEDGALFVFETEPHTPVVRLVEEACQPERHGIVRLARVGARVPSFDGEPRLDPLEPSRGVLLAARHLLNGPGSELLDDTFAGRRSRLVLELGGLLGRAGFWSLGSGRLDALIPIVEALP